MRARSLAAGALVLAACGRSRPLETPAALPATPAVAVEPERARQQPAPAPTEPAPAPTEPATGPDPAFDNQIAFDTIASKHRAIRACYEKGLATNPTLHGTVLYEITIDTAGHVASIREDEPKLPDGTVTSCIFDALRGLTFPTPARGKPVVVRYPFSFVPG